MLPPPASAQSFASFEPDLPRGGMDVDRLRLYIHSTHTGIAIHKQERERARVRERTGALACMAARRRDADAVHLQPRKAFMCRARD